MNILTVEAATESCSAALYTDQHIFFRQQLAPQGHSKLLLQMVDEILLEAKLSLADLDAFGYGCGPGSFTGLRIAASIIQGLAFATNKPVVAVSTLQALAQAAWRRFGYTQVFVALDAKIHEIYCGFYMLDPQNIMQNLATDQITLPAKLAIEPAKNFITPWHAVGSGVIVYQELLLNKLSGCTIHDANLYPSALEVAILAQQQFETYGGKPARHALPVYLRNQVAEKQASLSYAKVIKK